MKNIYLHIGRGKTGTTLIQNYLGVQRDLLAGHGVHYVHADDAGRGVGHQQFAKSFIAAPPAYMIPAVDPEEMRENVREEIAKSDARAFILSSENFPLADIDAVRNFFRSLGDGICVKIVFFARSQDEVAESEYNQMVKLKRETRPFSAYCDEALDDCDYMQTAFAWERAFGREHIICRIYDAGSRDVVGQFLDTIPELTCVERRAIAPEQSRGAANASIGMKALVAARLLNGIEIPDRKRLYGQMFEEFARDDLPALLLDSADAARFRARFAESNRAFTARYFGYESEDLGGRRHDDEERDRIRSQIASQITAID